MLFIKILTVVLLPLRSFLNAMRRRFIVILLFFIASNVVSQNSQLAYSYFMKGEYEKASVIFKELYEKNKVRRDYFKKLLSCYQLTDNFSEASILLESHSKEFPRQNYIWIEIGYNLQLQQQTEEAKKYYTKALQSIENNPHEGYILGQTFQDNHLLDEALQAYKRAMELDPNLNFEPYIAFVYGEKADIENMFNAYLNMVQKNENYFSTVQQYAGRFLSDDSLDENNILFKKLVLKRLQANPNDSWNKLLSWLYAQQKDYDKALVQEIALFKRSSEDLLRIQNLGDIAIENCDYNTAKEAFNYILENSKDSEEILDAHLYLLEIAIETASSQKEIDDVEAKFQELFSNYGNAINTLELQLSYADFLTFKKNEPEKAITVLKDALTKTSSDVQQGAVKLKLGDVLVFTDKFNEALINYSQVQLKLKNSTLAQTASYKVAQTSYFKGDFKWAMTQLKVLKKSTSQLIANDALDLHLLISNNIIGDSISALALKSYAHADLLAYQNRDKEAIDTLKTVLEKYEGRSIEANALFKQAELYTKTKQYNKAENNYSKIVELQNDRILVDNSYYQLGLLYENKLNDIEKAKEMYQKIIFEFPGSIYLVDARKRFRKLRGDLVN